MNMQASTKRMIELIELGKVKPYFFQLNARYDKIYSHHIFGDLVGTWGFVRTWQFGMGLGLTFMFM